MKAEYKKINLQEGAFVGENPVKYELVEVDYCCEEMETAVEASMELGPGYITFASSASGLRDDIHFPDDDFSGRGTGPSFSIVKKYHGPDGSRTSKRKKIEFCPFCGEDIETEKVEETKKVRVTVKKTETERVEVEIGRDEDASELKHELKLDEDGSHGPVGWYYCSSCDYSFPDDRGDKLCPAKIEEDVPYGVKGIKQGEDFAAVDETWSEAVHRGTDFAPDAGDETDIPNCRYCGVEEEAAPVICRDKASNILEGVLHSDVEAVHDG